MKKNTSFVCSSCGYDSRKWYGKCPSCGEWNTFQEISLGAPFQNTGSSLHVSARMITDIQKQKEERISTSFSELDRVLGGFEKKGIVPGSVTLLSGDPGVGKSTLLLQLAIRLSESGRKILYISGEESESQIKLRADRIAKISKKHQNLSIISTGDIESSINLITKEKPELVIVDSIQTLSSSAVSGFPGSIPQVRHATNQFVMLAKSLTIPIFLVGHVTKDGMVAGPMLLSHMVDCVLYLEGDKMSGTRILRAHKNRFGDTSEVGIFVMEEKGLIEAVDVTGLFMDEKNKNSIGACFTVVMEGSRPLLVEIQALVIPSAFTFPRRVASGISEKRLELLIAILQKYAKLPLDRYDVYINIVGGLSVKERALDLAICLAIVSSLKGKALQQTIAIAEVGLLGELKQVSNLSQRITEAEKFGFKNIVTVNSSRLLATIIKEKL